MFNTPWIVSEHVPDFSSLQRLVASPAFAGKAGQDLAVALWQLMVDRDLGIFHYFSAQERLWGKDVFDPLKVFNVYGFSVCHCHANVLAMLFAAARLPARIANIRGHEGTEAFYDGRWHYFDADIQMFHRLRPPRQHIIASREELYADPTLVSDQPSPSNPYHIPDRLPRGFAKLYESKPEYPELMEEQLHSMDFRLRSGEEMTRYFHHRGRWVVFAGYPEAFARYPSETGPEGPTERFWPRRQWGNGYFLYAPRLSAQYADVELGADSIQGLRLVESGLTCGAAGEVTFAFESPYIYCGVPDPMRRAPSVDGATLLVEFDLPEGTSAQVLIAPEHSRQWQSLWSLAGPHANEKLKLDFTPHVEGLYRFRLRVVLKGAGATLRSFQTKLWFMVSPHSLPALKTAGENRMSIHFGDQHGLASRPIVIEQRTDWPEWAEKVYATRNLRHEPGSYARLLPVDPAQPWQAVYELAAPEGGRMSWVRAYAIIEGRRPGEDYDGTPAAIEIADSPDGPWRLLAQREILEHPRGWHFGVFGQGRFGGQTGKGYVRFSAKKGANGFRIFGHYLPAEAAASPGQQPVLEIEHAWYEDDPQVGRRLATHVQRVRQSLAAQTMLQGGAQQYVVTCQHQPHDERISLRVPSQRR